VAGNPVSIVGLFDTAIVGIMGGRDCETAAHLFRSLAALPLRVGRQFLGLCLGQRCGQTITLAELDLRDRDGDTACTESEEAAHINKHGFNLAIGSHHNVFDFSPARSRSL
jgi:hypothetical protein